MRTYKLMMERRLPMTFNINIHKCEIILTNFWVPEKNSL